MSQSAELTGKAKKAQRSAERFQKTRKRHRAADLDVPEVDGEAAEAPAEEVTAEEPEKASKKRKRDDTATKEQEASQKATNGASEDAKAQKPKKPRKEQALKPDGAEPTADDANQAAGKHRFIVFIGNLPYSATTETIQKHFASIAPSSIRHRTDPQTKRSKGFAFLEFANYDKMKTCLKLYHHSMFDSGKLGEKQRKINVELTAGGGGKGEQRKEKLKTKNERLEEQRKRRAEALAKQENRKARKAGGPGGKSAAGAEQQEEAEEEPEPEVDGMHPARLARLQKGR